MKRSLLSFALLFVILAGCGEGTNPANGGEEEELYFPPAGSAEWETLSPSELTWNEEGLDTLLTFLEANNTRAFIVLKEGRIVVEEYWGLNVLGSADFDQNSVWYWASAGKTLTAFAAGIAQQEGFLDIDQSTSVYLGPGWTAMNSFREPRITIRNQLTMTSGLDYRFTDLDCTEPRCLTYLNDPGSLWYYHNAPYTLLQSVIASATGTSFENYVQTRIENQIGMQGQWISNQNSYNNVYWSTPRDAARFGLLIERGGVWNDRVIMTDPNYFTAMINSSQSLNPSYGFLWWLNGKGSIVLPGSPQSFNSSLAPSAPPGMIAALGLNGQFINVLFAEDIVVVRMGEAPDSSPVPVLFLDQMWSLLSEVIVN